MPHLRSSRVVGRQLALHKWKLMPNVSQETGPCIRLIQVRRLAALALQHSILAYISTP
jgi:hypothetical protein